MRLLRLSTWLLGSLLLLNSCNKCNEPAPEPVPAIEPDQVSVSYDQTQCADKWGQAATPQQLEALAVAYLAKQGITLAGPKASQTGPPTVCNACSCPTGVVLVGTVHVNQVTAIQALGFKVK
jgi:hypothetical protein